MVIKSYDTQMNLKFFFPACRIQYPSQEDFFEFNFIFHHNTRKTCFFSLISKQNRFFFAFISFFSHRSCIIGAQLEVKVCTLGTVINRTAYPSDYCQLEGTGRNSQPMPIRWMAWESVLLVSAENCLLLLFFCNHLVGRTMSDFVVRISSIQLLLHQKCISQFAMLWTRRSVCLLFGWNI